MPDILPNIHNSVSQHSLHKGDNHRWINIQPFCDGPVVFCGNHSKIDIMSLAESRAKDFDLDKGGLYIY